MNIVSTGVLDKNKEHYLRSKYKAEKAYDVSGHMQLHMSKYKNNKIYNPLGGKCLIHSTKCCKHNELQSLKLPCGI